MSAPLPDGCLAWSRPQDWRDISVSTTPEGWFCRKYLSVWHIKKKESLQCCFNQFNPFGKDNPTVFMIQLAHSYFEGTFRCLIHKLDLNLIKLPLSTTFIAPAQRLAAESDVRWGFKEPRAPLECVFRNDLPHFAEFCGPHSVSFSLASENTDGGSFCLGCST